ncbi:MAG: hypothetical protein AB3N33_10720 [Puniceicoccaceae bacterium]
MKGKYWVFIWLFLLLLEVLTYWIMRDRLQEVDASSRPLDEALIQLAEETNKAWLDWDVKNSPVPAGLVQWSDEHDLIERESLLLQLKDVQSGLIRPGIRMQIAEDLERWLEGGQSIQSQYSISQYIGNLIDWLQLLGQGTGRFSVESLSLHPDTEGTLPSLAFEFSGNPIDVGRTLLTLESGRIPWRLKEIDLIREEGGGSWWIRGSLSFANDPFR